MLCAAAVLQDTPASRSARPIAAAAIAANMGHTRTIAPAASGAAAASMDIMQLTFCL
jgi:hypothetical protein